MKFKKIISAVLTAAMVFGMTVMTSSAAEGDFIPTEDGAYTTSSVVAYQYYPYLSSGTLTASMCNGVFAGEADVTIDGDWATLELYVCNPTPSWGGLETGILSNAYITVDGVEYEGTLTSIGSTDADAAEKLFTQDSSFFGIVAGETYACDTMEFTIPTTALAGGTSIYNDVEVTHSYIEISALVNLGMNSQQNFFLELNYVEPSVDTTPDDTTPDDTTPDDTTNTQEVPVYATVLSNESTFTVTVPEDITFGDLEVSEDTNVDFQVVISDFLKGNDGAKVQVTSGNGVITDGTNTIDFVNSFGVQTAEKDITMAGTLTVSATDAASVPAGDYTGTVTFEILTVE